jgi:hypothetical protein
MVVPETLPDSPANAALAAAISGHGPANFLARHICRHRLDELPGIVDSIAAAPAPETAS